MNFLKSLRYDDNQNFMSFSVVRKFKEQVVLCSATSNGFDRPFTSDSIGVPFERKQKEIAP